MTTTRAPWTTFYRLTRHDLKDETYGEVPPPVLAERPSIPELIALALLDARTPLNHVERDRMAHTLVETPTPEDLPFTLRFSDTEWFEIGPCAEPTQNERLTISVGRQTAQEARDALAWFQLGQSEPVTCEVADDHLWVYLDACVLSWYLDTDDPEVHLRDLADGRREYAVGDYLDATAEGLADEDHDAICNLVQELMGNLAGFHYLAGAAALDAVQR